MLSSCKPEYRHHDTHNQREVQTSYSYAFLAVNNPVVDHLVKSNLLVPGKHNYTLTIEGRLYRESELNCQLSGQEYYEYGEQLKKAN